MSVTLCTSNVLAFAFKRNFYGMLYITSSSVRCYVVTSRRFYEVCPSEVKAAAFVMRPLCIERIFPFRMKTSSVPISWSSHSPCAWMFYWRFSFEDHDLFLANALWRDHEAKEEFILNTHTFFSSFSLLFMPKCGFPWMLSIGKYILGDDASSINIVYLFLTAKQKASELSVSRKKLVSFVVFCFFFVQKSFPCRLSAPHTIKSFTILREGNQINICYKLLHIADSNI